MEGSLFNFYSLEGVLPPQGWLCAVAHRLICVSQFWKLRMLSESCLMKAGLLAHSGPFLLWPQNSAEEAGPVVCL